MPDAISLGDVQNRTDQFFDLHWPHDEERPSWSDAWSFAGEIPNQRLQGCYAILLGESVVYIGVGAGKGSGIYEGAGLGSRLHRYWRTHSKTPKAPDGTSLYEPTGEWAGATGIATIGFPAGRGYLAYALEPYLIGHLKPERNVVGT